MNNLSNAYSYNDLSSLNSITKLGKTDEAAALKEVARQFESMFVGMMLKSMRDANAVFEEGNPLNSNESKFYRQMFDDQLALSLSKGKGMGLADTLYRQMKEQFDIKEKEDTTVKDASMGIKLERNNLENPFSIQRPNLKFNGSNNSQPKAISEPVKSINTDLPVGFKINPEKNKIDNIEDLKLTLKDTTPKPQGFSTPQDFVNTLWPISQSVGKILGVAPKAILAQAALETGWGKYIIQQKNGQSSHNLFGIKADKRWNGPVTKVATLEFRQGIAKKEVAPFRVYQSYEASLNDYASFIKNSDRYKNAVKEGQSVRGYSEGLQKGGYATDPNYAQKIQRIASGDVLNHAIDRIKRG